MVEEGHLKNVMPWISRKGYHYAIEELDYTLVTFPNHPDALQLLWLYAKGAKKPSAAIPYFENAIRLYPQYAETYYLYGAFLTDFGMSKEGILKLEKALEIAPGMAGAHAWIAIAHDKSGDGNKARESAQKAVELGYRGDLLKNILKKNP
jgi:Tfp pilus assembly protein PilF